MNKAFYALSLAGLFLLATQANRDNSRSEELQESLTGLSISSVCNSNDPDKADYSLSLYPDTLSNGLLVGTLNITGNNNLNSGLSITPAHNLQNGNEQHFNIHARSKDSSETKPNNTTSIPFRIMSDTDKAHFYITSLAGDTHIECELPEPPMN